MTTKINFKRQTLIFDPSDFSAKTVGIVGLGNIGSHTALALARLGIQNFLLCDFDTVEGHNLSSQAFDQEDLEKTKVGAISGKIRAINKDIAVVEVNERFNAKSEAMANMRPDILIISVDSMKSRKSIAKMFTGDYLPHIIDARIGGNQLEVYNICSLEQWEKTFSDNPSTDPCGGRYISYVSLMVAGVIANQVKKFLKGEKMDENIIMDANTLQVVKNVSWK